MPLPIEERFMSHVEKDDSGCWLWQAFIGPTGYGDFWANNKMQRAHRWSYSNWNGSLIKGLTIDHLCRVRNCVNPEHLEQVTIKENVLRGESFVAKNAAKTHCHKGHEFKEDNIYLYRGRRMCKTCRKKNQRQTVFNREQFLNLSTEAKRDFGLVKGGA